MDLLLTHTSALEVLRRPDAQWRDAEAVVPRRAPTRSAMEALLARSRLLASLAGPVELLVSAASARINNDLVRTHVMSAELPAGSVVEIMPGVRAASPELLPVLMAPALTELELICLLSELLGTYAIAPQHEKGMWQRREPLTTPDRIRALLARLGPVRGAGMVRRALGKACVGSASPRETKLSLRLGLPPRMGGWGLRVLSMNDPVEVRRIRDAMSVGVRKPDILLRARGRRGRGVAVEYDGRDHEEEQQHARDIERHNELVAMGFVEFIVARRQYKDLTYTEGLVARIRGELGLPPEVLEPGEAERGRALRQRLYEELELIDGVRWDGRARERARNAAEDVGVTDGVDDGWNVVPVEAYGL